VSTDAEIVASVFDSSARDVLERLGRSVGAAAGAFAALPSGLVRDTLRLQQEIEQFRLTAERVGVSQAQADQLVDEVIDAVRPMLQPFRIEDAYDRLWRLVQPPDPVSEDETQSVFEVLAALASPWADPTYDPVMTMQMWAQRCGSPVAHPSMPPGRLCFMDADGSVNRRYPGESRIDATERVLSSYSYGRDSASFDSRPEHCWRCDAKGAETDVGLCTPCHDDLRAP
jgi:hypothetical protein